MVKSNSDFRRSSAPTVFGRINSPSSDVYNPLSNSTHDVKQLQRPLVDASDDIPDDTAGSDDLRDTYLSPSIPPYSDSAAVTRLFKSQSESGTPRASPGPSASPAPGLSPYYPPLPPSQSTSLRGLFQEDSPTETADRSP